MTKYYLVTYVWRWKTVVHGWNYKYAITTSIVDAIKKLNMDEDCECYVVHSTEISKEDISHFELRAEDLC